MRQIRKGYVDIPEGQVHYHLCEGSDPAVVFLHQTALSARTNDPLLRVLDIPNRLIAFDTPGFGESFAPEGAMTLESYADQMLAAIARLADGPVHLFGHHTGASLAIEMAARAPDKVRSLILAGPVFMTEDERQQFIAGYSEPISPERDGSHVMVNWNYATGNNSDCDLAILQDAVAAMLRAWRARPQAYMAVAHHDTAGRAGEVACPVLLLTSPGDFFRGSFDRAQALFPEAAWFETPGDNFPTATHPEGVAEAIAPFIASA